MVKRARLDLESSGLGFKFCLCLVFSYVNIMQKVILSEPQFPYD